MTGRCSEQGRRKRVRGRGFFCWLSGKRAGRGPDDQNEEGNGMNSKTKGSVTRRALLKTTGAGALMAALGAEFPFGAHVAQAAGPETTKANLGFIALTDAAPLFVAKEKGI